MSKKSILFQPYTLELHVKTNGDGTNDKKPFHTIWNKTSTAF
jgi:hypothetical protein